MTCFNNECKAAGKCVAAPNTGCRASMTAGLPIEQWPEKAQRAYAWLEGFCEQRSDLACGVHGPIPCEGAGCTCGVPPCDGGQA